MKKDSFLMYLSFEELLMRLTPDELRRMMLAVFRYHGGGIEPDFSDNRVLEMCWQPLKSQFERDAEKYANICKRNIENGKNGGRPTESQKNPKKPKKPSGFSENPKEPKKTDTDTGTDLKENPLTGVKEKTQPPPLVFDFPHSVDEVLKLAEHPWCGMQCSKEQAEAYFTDRLAKDWIPYGQQKQISSLAQVCADLKKWLMRDLNNENERKQKNANNSKRDVRVIANDPTEFDPADDGSNI